MKRKAIAIIGLLLTLAFTAPAADYNFNARTRVYLYTMAGSFHLTAAGSGLWNEVAVSDEGFSLNGGIGFSMLNINNRFFLNLEADYMASAVNYRGAHDRGVKTLSFMIQGEYRLGRLSPVSVYGGVGVGVIFKDEAVLPGIYDDWLRVEAMTDVTFAGELGIKVSLSRRLMFRAALRFYSLVDGYDDIEYWGGYWGDYWDLWLDDYDSELYATSFMAGLEIHF